MKLITKQAAIALVGEAEVRRIVEWRDTSLLPSGAKLFTRKQGCVTRFGVYGYAHDKSDMKGI